MRIQSYKSGVSSLKIQWSVFIFIWGVFVAISVTFPKTLVHTKLVKNPTSPARIQYIKNYSKSRRWDEHPSEIIMFGALWFSAIWLGELGARFWGVGVGYIRRQGTYWVNTSNIQAIWNSSKLCKNSFKN